MGTNLTYIPLDTCKESLFGSFQSLLISEEYLFFQTPNSILQFNRQGKFIRTLCCVGRGPSECELILSVSINDKNQKVYVRGFTSCLEFDFNGNFLANHSLSGIWWNFRVTDHQELLVNPYNAMGNAEDKLTILTFSGDTLQHFNNHQLFSTEDNFLLPYLSVFNPYEDQIIFRQQFSDTVFTYHPTSRTLSTRYTFDFSGLGVTPDILAQGSQLLNNCVYLSEWYETSRYIHLRLTEKGKTKLYLIHKGENKIYRSVIRIKEYGNQLFKPIALYQNTLAAVVSPESENGNYVVVLLEKQ